MSNFDKEEDIISFRLNDFSQNTSECLSQSNGSLSDIIYRDVDENITNLKFSIEILAHKIEDVTFVRDKKAQIDKKLIDENKNLQKKINLLESEIEKVNLDEQALLAKERRIIDYDLKRILTAKNQEIDEFRVNVSKTEKQLADLRTTSLIRNREVDQLKYDVIRLNSKINNNKQQYDNIEHEFRRLKEISKRETDIYSLEVEHCKNNYEEIKSKLEPTNKKLSNILPIVEQNITNLHQQIQNLSHENRSIKEDIEDCHVELLTKSIKEGRSLLGADEISWAVETDTCNKSELIELIIQEKDLNWKLRQYSDKLIGKIIDVDASIFEV